MTGVPPSIALEQRTSRGGANSTVATVTEVAHYLRLLYAKVGELHCPKCDAVVAPMSADALFEAPRALASRRRPAGDAAHALRAGRPRAEGHVPRPLHDGLAGRRAGGARRRRHRRHRPAAEAREDEGAHDRPHRRTTASSRTSIAPTFDRALSWGGGRGARRAGSAQGDARRRRGRADALDGARVPALRGPACPSSIRAGSRSTRSRGAARRARARASRVDRRRSRSTRGRTSRATRAPGRASAPSRAACACSGRRTRRRRPDRLRAPSRASKTWRFVGRDALVAKSPHAELVRRLAFVQQVGLGYLALDRPANTLSGGEMQRLRLSAQLGSGLTGALYVLDEPTIGLHPRDTGRLLANLRAARGHGLDGARRRARRGHDPRGRSRDRPRPRRRSQRRSRRRRGAGRAGPRGPALADGARARGDRARRAPEATDGRRVDRALGRARAQPARRRLSRARRAHVRRGRRQRLGQVDARASRLLPGAPARARPRRARRPESTRA